MTEVELLANERYSLELKHQGKVREVEDLNLLLDDKSSQCDCCESENTLLLGKIKTCEKKEGELNRYVVLFARIQIYLARLHTHPCRTCY